MASEGSRFRTFSRTTGAATTERRGWNREAGLEKNPRLVYQHRKRHHAKRRYVAWLNLKMVVGRSFRNANQLTIAGRPLSLRSARPA